MKIGLSTTGYHSVDLKCGADAFLVNVTLDADFDGVLYTRGDFSSKRAPCFLTSKDVAHSRGTNVVYTLKLPFTQCHTVEVKKNGREGLVGRKLGTTNICVTVGRQ